MKDECPVSIDELRHDAKSHELIVEEDPDVDFPNLTSGMSEEAKRQFDTIQALVDDWREEGTDPYLLGCSFHYYMNQELIRQLRDIKKKLT